MSALRFPLLLVLLGFTSFVSTAGVVYTSSNLVPQSSVADVSQAQGVNDLKPGFCTNTLDVVIAGTGNFAGTGKSELILGSAVTDTITGVGGADCILGGGGDDTLTGGAGSDIVSGGPGIDVCTGGPGGDSFPLGDCETTNP